MYSMRLWLYGPFSLTDTANKWRVLSRSGMKSKRLIIMLIYTKVSKKIDSLNAAR